MNKIKYGLKNVHIALQTYSEATGEYSYAAPVKLPGAVNLSLDPEGEASPFYADDVVYYRTVANNGYSGSLEIALVTEWFRQHVLQEKPDSNGVLIENSNSADPAYFAMLFEFEGDAHGIRHVMYNCSVTRPGVGSQTKEASITPGTETLNLTCDPRSDGLVKARTADATSESVYSNWFSSVYVPDTEAEAAKLSALTVGSLTLTPAFDAGTLAYTASTTNDSDAVAASGAAGASVVVRVNGSVITNGEAPEWNTGNNSVTVTVSKSGLATSTYAVTVIKSAS